MIAKCECVNVWQDEQYGPRMRVHNEVTKKSSPGHVVGRCVVCSQEHQLARKKSKVELREEEQSKRDEKKKALKTVKSRNKRGGMIKL